MKDTSITYTRRLGPDPHADGKQSSSAAGCPDIWELDNGDFAFIGVDITESKGDLPPTAGCGPDERIVRIPRDVLLAAKNDIASV